MSDASYWLRQAALASKLAREASHGETAQELLELARQFEARAMSPLADHPQINRIPVVHRKPGRQG